MSSIPVELSIIIPVYNVEQYLTATLENVLSQSYQNYELILVDDGSTDRSSEICDYFANLNQHVRVIHQANAGVSAARNVGVAAAKGKYIGFVDSDDLIEPTMFQILVDIAEREEADVVQCRHNRSNTIKQVQRSEKRRILDGLTFVRELFDYTGGEYTNQVALWSKIYHRELFSEIYFPVGYTYEDERETYKLCLKARKLIQISDELYHYIKRENSIITGISPEKMIDKQLALIDRLQYLSDCLPELTGKCADSLINYSKGIMCQIYQSKKLDFVKSAIYNLKPYRRNIAPFMNKYDKIYFWMLFHGISYKWILKNEFAPIQRTFAGIKKVYERH